MLNGRLSIVVIDSGGGGSSHEEVSQEEPPRKVIYLTFVLRTIDKGRGEKQMNASEVFDENQQAAADRTQIRARDSRLSPSRFLLLLLFLSPT